jgi:hypothetical protein
MDMIVRDYIISPHTFVAAEHCAAARVYRGPPREPGPAMWHGIAVHRYLEYVQTRGKPAAIRYIASKFKRLVNFCDALDIDSIPRGQPEVQFIINTAEQVAAIIDTSELKAEATPRDHVMVKADLLAEGHWVIDYKTGKRPVDPATAPQSMMEALATWLWFDKPDTVRASIFNVTKEAIIQTHHDWRADELHVAMKRLRRVHLLTVETRLEFKHDSIDPPQEPGEHCNRCDAASVCPSSAAVSDPPRPRKESR